MKKEKFYLQEQDVIESFERKEDRLDSSIEIHRLINVAHNLLISHPNVDSESFMDLYEEVKQNMRREYTAADASNLDYKQMKVWHLAMFTCLDILRKELNIAEFESNDAISNEFAEILDNNLESTIDDLAKEEDIDEFSNDIMRELSSEVEELELEIDLLVGEPQDYLSVDQDRPSSPDQDLRMESDSSWGTMRRV